MSEIKEKKRKKSGGEVRMYACMYGHHVTYYI